MLKNKKHADTLQQYSDREYYVRNFVKLINPKIEYEQLTLLYTVESFHFTIYRIDVSKLYDMFGPALKPVMQVLYYINYK